MAENDGKYDIHRHQKDVVGGLRRTQQHADVCPENKEVKLLGLKAWASLCL